MPLLSPQRSHQSLAKPARLRSEDVKFDGGRKTPITSYINRLKFLADTYGDEAVLSVLPLGMIGEAQIWLDSLSEDTLMHMNNDLYEWFEQLRRRFSSNASQALREADQMRHTFEDESTLDVRKYLSKKQSLYREAGEEVEDLIVRRLHDGLDPTLAAIVSLRLYCNCIDNFQKKVYNAEPAA